MVHKRMNYKMVHKHTTKIKIVHKHTFKYKMVHKHTIKYNMVHKYINFKMGHKQTSKYKMVHKHINRIRNKVEILERGLHNFNECKVLNSNENL